MLIDIGNSLFVDIARGARRAADEARVDLRRLHEELERSRGHQHRTIEIPPHLVSRRSSLRQSRGEPRIL